jgi:hypothetical protein
MAHLLPTAMTAGLHPSIRLPRSDHHGVCAPASGRHPTDYGGRSRSEPLSGASWCLALRGSATSCWRRRWVLRTSRPVCSCVERPRGLFVGRRPLSRAPRRRPSAETPFVRRVGFLSLWQRAHASQRQKLRSGWQPGRIPRVCPAHANPEEANPEHKRSRHGCESERDCPTVGCHSPNDQDERHDGSQRRRQRRSHRHHVLVQALGQCRARDLPLGIRYPRSQKAQLTPQAHEILTTSDRLQRVEDVLDRRRAIACLEHPVDKRACDRSPTPVAVLRDQVATASRDKRRYPPPACPAC